jgi:clan AA aspartic protease
MVDADERGKAQARAGPSMGEVRVRARLTNAGDEELVRRGFLAPGQVRTYEADALVDTGAVRTVVPPDVVARLGLGLRGERVAEYADGRQETVSVTGPLLVEINGRDTLDEALVLGDEVLIGQTVLEKLDLIVDCQRQRVSANPAHPDHPVTKVKWTRARSRPSSDRQSRRSPAAARRVAQRASAKGHPLNEWGMRCAPLTLPSPRRGEGPARHA